MWHFCYDMLLFFNCHIIKCCVSSFFVELVLCFNPCTCVLVCMCLGQCQVNGIALFDGAMWSPQPCSACQCNKGNVKCQPIPCTGRTQGASISQFLIPSLTLTTTLTLASFHVVQVTPAMTVKPESTKNKKQEVLVKIPTRGTKMHVPIAPARPPMPAVKSTKDRFHSSDEDDFDDDPDSRPVVTFPQKPNFMESLPAGCLLSESLILNAINVMLHCQYDSIKLLASPVLVLLDNKISKIPVRALAGLPNLEWLDLSKNKLDDSSLSPLLFQNLTKLRRLILDGNNLTKVPAFLPPSLEELKINDNKLSGLTPSSLSKLLTLELEDNYFHDGNVSPLTFRPLRKLIYLRLEDNKFRAIPSGLPASLQELHLSDNKIEEVHAGILNKTVNLRLLDLSHNRIREDRIAPRAWIHLSNLESLDLSHNKLVHVPSFLPVGLRQLTLHHNQIERIPGYVFGHMRPGLDSLQLSHNRLRDDGIDGVSFLGLSTSLSELLLDHNLLQSIPQGLLQLKNLQLLRLNHNLIRYCNSPPPLLCSAPPSREDSPLISVHLQYNLIERRLIPPTAFSCIRNYHSILLRPQRHENDE
uniref:Si:dkey-6n6.1 n=1 Tax=Myripristis murdjan TaxID=586833 RepID=A0A668AFX1_9TELE